MSSPTSPSNPDYERFGQRVGELRQSLQSRNPARLAALTGSVYQDEAFFFKLWDRPLRLTFPALTAHPADRQEELPVFNLALLLYYFNSASGAPETGEWISFADLPDGRFYNQAFQGYTGQELSRCFANDLAGFERAAIQLGGLRQPLGDASFSFRALPRVSLLAIYWQGDEDFPASCQILFDSSASHYLPTDGYAILGSALTRKLIQASAPKETS
jgi:hypothetical protein